MHVLITGASSGIGAALAKAWAARPGARLSLVARRRDRLEALASELAVPTCVIVRDLSDPDAVAGVLAEAEAAHGPIDVLVNNAGVQVIGRSDKVDIDWAERSLRVNLTTPLRFIHEVLPSMRRRNTGLIVNIASMSALAPTPGMTWYNAAKGGLAGASEALGGELRGTGIAVLTVYPGIIQTDMADAALGDFEPTALLRLQPIATARTLAANVLRAADRRRTTLVYPRIYAPTRWLRPLVFWVMTRFTPAMKEQVA